MENDPVYKMLEDKFYKVFDMHIVEYAQKIAAKIEGFQKEREYVRNHIESIART